MHKDLMYLIGRKERTQQWKHKYDGHGQPKFGMFQKTLDDT